MSYRSKLFQLDSVLLHRIDLAQQEIDWIRNASGNDLLDLATNQLGLRELHGVADDLTAVELGNFDSGRLRDILQPHFAPGTSTADDLADQVQLCRAFADPRQVTDAVTAQVRAAIANFPRNSAQLQVGSNPGDVLDPFILAANYEILSERNLPKTVEHTASHKVLMKIEDLVGNLHQTVISMMRGNFRVPEPRGSRSEGKENLDPALNPFPGTDVGQVPIPERPESLRLFQVKSKTGSAKGGDGKRLGEQLRTLEAVYNADTFYVAIVGNTLRGHRSKGAVVRESPNTAVLVGEAALNEITQSSVGGELLLRTYQRAFRAASEESGYNFSDIVSILADDFEKEAEREGTDFLSAWLHVAVGGRAEEQDSRLAIRGDLRHEVTPGHRRRRTHLEATDVLWSPDNQ